MAFKNPRVGEERRRCRETMFVEWRWATRSGRDRVLAFVRSIEGGSVEGSVRSVSANQAMSSRTHRIEPPSASITSEIESADDSRREVRAEQRTWVFKR